MFRNIILNLQCRQSVMEIGEYVMFIYQGKKLWEGTNKNIFDCGVKELEDFIFANNLMRTVRRQNEGK